MPRTHDYLYQEVADDISNLIEKGEYKFNEKIPSLRTTKERYSVSLATAVQAYQILEERGVIESRAKSGYFVCNRQQDRSYDYEPDITQPASTPTPVNVAQLAMSLVTETRQTGLVKLGAAVPESSLLPLANLSRTMAGVARRHYLAAAAYANVQGSKELRIQVARLMREAGVRCGAEDIVITNGCLEALTLALRCVADRGDIIAIESPTYFGVLQVIESLGMNALEISTDVNTGIVASALKQALSKRKVKACVLMPSFNNPTGSTMSEQCKQQVVTILEQYRIPIIEDDVYGSLSYVLPRPKAIKSYDKSDNILYCSSFSKTIAPGLRLGWIIPGRYIDKVKYQKFLDNIGTAIHSQLTMAEFLGKGSYRRTLRHASRVYRQRMDLFRKWILEYFPAGTKISNPEGGFLVWVELPKKYKSQIIYRDAMNMKITITPGILFSAQGQYKNHLRLSCGAIEGEKLRKAILKLSKIIG
jgi:DNA-binding transcriptional MocR family regulator